MPRNVKNVYEITLIVVENWEAGTCSAFFSPAPMEIGTGNTAGDAINNLVKLSRFENLTNNQDNVENISPQGAPDTIGSAGAAGATAVQQGRQPRPKRVHFTGPNRSAQRSKGHI